MNNFSDVINYFNDNRTLLERYKSVVEQKFLMANIFQYIHSYKTRIKDQSHLLEKLNRKQSKYDTINKENLFTTITDLIGIRLLILYPAYFEKINDHINSMVANEELILHEDPIVYTWDPEFNIFFQKIGFKNIEIKESYYTSVHYVVTTNKSQQTPRCEIQVRTLFEEIWGEIDHQINYPQQCDIPYIQPHLKVLGNLVATGTKLTNIIYELSKPSTPETRRR